MKRHAGATVALIALVLSLPLFAAGPVGSGVGEHGWAVYRNAVGKWTLVHFEPRAAGDREPVDPGSTLAVRTLGVCPEMIAAHGRTAYLVFPPVLHEARLIRRVSSVRAARNPLGDGWMYEPSAFLNAHPALSGHGTLRGCVAPGGVLHALINTEQGWTLQRLGRDAWETIDLPVGDTPADMMVLAWEETVLLLSKSTDGQSIAAALGEGDRWEPMTIAGLERVWDASFVLGHRNEIIAGVDETGSETDGATLGVHALRSTSDLMVQSIAGLPADMGSVILEESGTLVLVAWSPLTKGMRLVEIDLGSGRVLYDAKPLGPAWFNSGLLASLLMMFFAVGSLIVVIVVRPPAGFSIPEGCSLSDPPRRFSATLIDLLILSVIIAPVFDVGIFELFTGNVLARPDGRWVALPALLVSGMIAGSVWESTLGGTPGKLIARVRVVRAEPGELRSLPVHRVLVRNLIKWFLPPIAMMSILDPGFRHRGDQLARAVVVVRNTAAVEEKEDPGSSS